MKIFMMVSPPSLVITANCLGCCGHCFIAKAISPAVVLTRKGRKRTNAVY